MKRRGRPRKIETAKEIVPVSSDMSREERALLKYQNTRVQMEKPSFSIGDVVNVMFIGIARKCIITDGPYANPNSPNRWIYDVEQISSKTKIPFVGIKNTEEFANIIAE